MGERKASIHLNDHGSYTDLDTDLMAVLDSLQAAPESRLDLEMARSRAAAIDQLRSAVDRLDADASRELYGWWTAQNLADAATWMRLVTERAFDWPACPVQWAPVRNDYMEHELDVVIAGSVCMPICVISCSWRIKRKYQGSTGKFDQEWEIAAHVRAWDPPANGQPRKMGHVRATARVPSAHGGWKHAGKSSAGSEQAWIDSVQTELADAWWKLPDLAVRAAKRWMREQGV